MDTTETVTHLGLCAGYGGIELGLKRIYPTMRSVALCEIEAFAIANLVSKMESGFMDPVPIWTDLKTFPWKEFSGKVDILTSGYPCQPFSNAGNRKGEHDERHLWPYIADGISILRPAACFFENVEGHVSLGLSTVISDLEQLGYRTTWSLFSAAECGSPQIRRRVFILAVSSSLGGKARLSRPIQGEERQARIIDYFSNESWPSGPLEPQHAWEPPRVMVYSKGKQSASDDNGGESGAACDSEQIEFGGTDGWTLREGDGDIEPEMGGSFDGASDRDGDAIVYASDCLECECCGEPVCPNCNDHYAECPCKGPDSSND